MFTLYETINASNSVSVFTHLPGMFPSADFYITFTHYIKDSEQ